MLEDDAEEQGGMAGDEIVTDSSGAERRRALRRRLPFGRGAILLVGERAHIVGLADVSVTGAYLTARAPVSPGETHVLKILVLPARLEIELKAEVVRVSLVDPESPDHPRGVAVRFLDMDETAREYLQAFVARVPQRVRR
jgi:hypothetical protein